jgi:hypothetical protein
MEPALKTSAGMIPTFRSEHCHAPRPDVGVDPEHVVCREALGDADHGLDARVNRLVDRVGREPRGNEDHRRVRAGLGDRLRDGVEDRHALDVLTTLAGSDARDQLRPIGAVTKAVEGSLAPGQALDDELRVAVDDDRHA